MSQTFLFSERQKWAAEQDAQFRGLWKRTHGGMLYALDYRDHEGDWLDGSTGDKIELKTDSYSGTGNMFLEHYSNLDKKTLGGMYRAVTEKIDIFVYWFPKDKVWYEFRDLKKVVKVLTKLTDKKGEVRIQNRGWLTTGHKIPIAALSKYFTEVKYE